MLPYSLSHRSLDTIKDGVLTVAAFDKFHPISFFENGKLEGIEIKIMEEYAKAVGLTVKFVRVGTWDKIWDKPRLKEADVSIGGIANSMGRDHKNTEWSMPYYYVKRSFISLKKPLEKAKFTSFSAIPNSTGYVDARWRLGELMMSLTPGQGYEKDLKRLRQAKVRGIMYGDQVSRSILKEEKMKKRNDLTMKTWDILPTIVPSDGETFSFPTRLGSGIAVSLSSFLAYAESNGLLKKWCKAFHLKYPVVPKTLKIKTDQEFKKRKELKKLIRLFLQSPDYEPARQKYDTIFIQAKKHLSSLFDRSENSNTRVERLKEALKRTDVEDHGLFLFVIEIVLSYLSYLMSDKYSSGDDVWLAKKKGCYNCHFDGENTGRDNMWFDFIVYESVSSDLPNVSYLKTKNKGVAYINTSQAWKNVRNSGNTIQAFIDEVVHIGKLIIPLVLEKEGGVQNVSKYLN